ncbi:hypothetical protein LTR86_001262 [Recurvomyces mirabilis]|nr:hypothetical protein LTR86_001262 [Recurvomyces mirabilis]
MSSSQTRPRDQAPSPETPRRASAKRTYNGMDDNGSETSEYLPAKKGKKRAASVITRSDPVESSSTAEKRRRKRQRRDSAAADGAPTGAKEDLELLLAQDTPAGRLDATVEHARRARHAKRRETTAQQLERLQTENTKLEERLAKCANDVKKAQLDSLLRTDGEEKKYEELNRKYRRLQGLYSEKSQCLEEKSAQVPQLEMQLKSAKDSVISLRVSVTNLMSQVSKHDREVMGYEDAMKTAQEDIEALRRIEIDVRAEQDRAEERYNTLPPAYGSLPEPEPRYRGVVPHEAVDSGVLTIANLKHTVRTEFMANVKMFRKMQDSLRNKAIGCIQHNNADGAYIRGVHEAFGDACRNIGAVMDRAVVAIGDFTSLRAILHGEEPTGGLTTAAAFREELQKSEARHGFVADRTAKLLLDLAVRLVSALELRPLHVGAAFGYEEKNEIALVWSSFDATLSKSLRCLSKVTGGTTSSQIIETCIQLQTFLAQVKALQEVMGSVRVRTGVGYYGAFARYGEGKYLGETSEWLVDQLEVWRTIAAKTADEEALARRESEHASLIPATLTGLVISSPSREQNAEANRDVPGTTHTRTLSPWALHEVITTATEDVVAQHATTRQDAQGFHDAPANTQSPTRSPSVVRGMITAAQQRLHNTRDEQDEEAEISSVGTPHNSDNDGDELVHDGSIVDPVGERGSRRALTRRCSRLRSFAQRGNNSRPRRLTPMETHDEEFMSDTLSNNDIGDMADEAFGSSDGEHV